MDGFKKLPKMQCFKTGGKVEAKAMCYGGKMKEGGKSDLAQDKKVVKKAFAMHDKQEHPGEKTDLSKLKKGGRSKKEAGTVRKYKAGGDVTNVYEAKKKAGDKDAIKKVKQITPAKAASSSAALKGVGNTTAAFKKGGNVSEAGKKAGDKDATVKTKMGPSKADTKSAAMKKGGKVKKYANGKSVDAPVDVKDPQALTDRIAREENEADRDLVMKPIRAVGKVISKGVDAAKSAIKGQGVVTETERSNINKKKGGKIKKYADGGTVMSDEEKAWLGGADATDPFIQARMRAALGPKKAAPVAPSRPDPAMIEDESGRGNVTAAQQLFNQEVPGSGINTTAAPSAPVRRAPAALPAGPSADDRLRAKYGRPIQAPNVEQDSGVAYPQGNPAPNMYANREPSAMQRFFNATPAEQAANFQRGVQARKNFGKTTPGSTPSFSSLLDALNKPKA